MTTPSKKVSVYSGAAGDEQPRDRQSLLAGAQDALFSSPSLEVRQNDRVLAAAGLGSLDSGSEAEEDGHGQEDEPEDFEHPDEDPLDDEAVYLSEGHRDWEMHYLRRLGMHIHRMVTAELDRSEEALFMIFVGHDANLDGRVKGEEAKNLLQVIEDYAPGSLDESSPADTDGTISFVSLLRWYSGSKGGEHRDTSYAFSATSLLTGLLGSGMAGCDARLQALDWMQLRRNIIGYRRLYNQVRSFLEERMLTRVQDFENESGILAAIPEYYKLLGREFEGDAEHLFELFSEVDESNNLLLEFSEVETLLRHLDTGASDEDVRRYITEMALEEGPTSFASLVDWWDQARNVSNSLVAEKGTALIAGIKSRAYSSKMSGLFTETTVQKRWAEAERAGTLENLRDAYCRTIKEYRQYKAERNLQMAESDCAKL
eukprot:TRINITY_DN43173_c0_g1_i1.p1 TRINITY_DN43173_c0_g1~~TRINITY_DN43173_c0_g1_i1.p1  ORF type:complete len:429 (-),score=83.85 TRINITY_DN43173_c0_g1_i1:30-1316(-)